MYAGGILFGAKPVMTIPFISRGNVAHTFCLCGMKHLVVQGRCQRCNLAHHVDKRGLEPYARYTLTHWSRP